jgi:hypothetical protein
MGIVPNIALRESAMAAGEAAQRLAALPRMKT